LYAQEGQEEIANAIYKSFVTFKKEYQRKSGKQNFSTPIPDGTLAENKTDEKSKSDKKHKEEKTETKPVTQSQNQEEVSQQFLDKMKAESNIKDDVKKKETSVTDARKKNEPKKQEPVVEPIIDLGSKQATASSNTKAEKKISGNIPPKQANSNGGKPELKPTTVSSSSTSSTNVSASPKSVGTGTNSGKTELKPTTVSSSSTSSTNVSALPKSAGTTTNSGKADLKPTTVSSLSTSSNTGSSSTKTSGVTSNSGKQELKSTPLGTSALAKKADQSPSTPSKKIEPTTNQTKPADFKPVASVTTYQTAKNTPTATSSQGVSAGNSVDKVKSGVQSSKTEKKDENASKLNPVAQNKADLQTEDGVVYKLQLFALSKKQSVNNPAFKGLAVDYFEEGGLYKYTFGSTKSYDQILKLKKEIASKFPNAMIVALKNGKKVPIPESTK
jgi:hypothetical protein